ncbi:GntP family permease [Sporosarcina thermotolerans]|uniref:GntP family permease n=1 Tax=Sporosarcina thermotolerans TaxID=633404 RepID=A0AAW9A9P0_9BACL|nr:GntP family permease [Sporosarcina thermotolerans]MDW0116346.1 GntP family permease [Sporosarcina thermotolerans]WHT48309.1 GntP family permease [Sporosarcina thermotolerans]
MESIQVIGILLAIALIVFAAMKGFNILIVAPIASIIVIVTNQMDLFTFLVGAENSYMTGLAGFIINFFAVFILGSILAKYIDTSGAAHSIAQKILSKTGTDKPFPVLVALFIITAVLTYGGLSLFVVVFVLVPLAKPLFKQLNIAWNIITIPIMLGLGTFTMTMLPATPSIQNVVPTAYLGTTLTAAPLLGIIGTVVAIAFGLWYMKSVLTKSIARGETFADYEVEDTKVEVKKEVPPFLLSILPIVLLIAIILIGSAFEVANIILIALISSIVVSALIFNNYIPSQKVVVNEGAVGSIMPVFLTSSTVAFGVVITLAPGFTYISEFILGIPGNPLISLSIASAAFGAITGSASGSLGIVMEAFADNYLAMGIAPEAIHRVAAIASAVFTVMPHTGVVLTFFALTGLNHKNGFKYQFIAMTGANLLALIAVIIAAILIY